VRISAGAAARYAGHPRGRTPWAAPGRRLAV
jgi:hypothetical protein